jgi:O-antigen/teichoic acid export membrane protein
LKSVKPILRLSVLLAAAQGVVLVTTPVLTRAFGPEAFGAAGGIWALLAVISPFACLRFEQGIAVADSRAQAKHITVVSVFALLVVSLGAAALLLCVPSNWIDRLGVSHLCLAAIVVLACWVAGASALSSQWCARTSRFGRLGAGRVARPLVGSLSAMTAVVGTSFRSPIALVGAQILGGIAELLVVAGPRAIWRLFNGRAELGNFSHWTSVARTHRGLAIYSAPAILANTLSWQLPVIVLSMAFDTTIAGLYAISLKALQGPLSVLGSSSGIVLQQRYRESDLNSRRIMLEQYVQFAVGCSVPVAAALVIAAPQVAKVVLGAEWETAGIYLQALAPGLAAWFVSSPISFTFNIHKVYRLELRSQITILTARVVALVLGVYLGSAWLTILLLGMASAIAYSTLLIRILSVSATPLTVLFRALGHGTLLAATITVPLSLLAVEAGSENPLSCVSCFTAGALAPCISLAFLRLRRDKPEGSS